MNGESANVSTMRADNIPLRIDGQPAMQHLAVTHLQFEDFGERDIEQAGPDAANHAGVRDQQAALVRRLAQLAS